jgi:hypothetical protein
MRHLLSAMVLCIVLPSLVFAENLADLRESLSEAEENSEELQEIPSLGGVVTATSCKPLTCDVPLTDTIQTPTTRDCFSFSVPQSTRVQISVVRDSSSPAAFWPLWRLLTSQGTPESTCGGWSTAHRARLRPPANQWQSLPHRSGSLESRCHRHLPGACLSALVIQ